MVLENIIFNGNNALCVLNLFTNSPIMGCLDYFPFVAITNDTLMNTHVHKPLGIFVIIPQVYLLQAGRLPVGPAGLVCRLYIPLQQFYGHCSSLKCFIHWHFCTEDADTQLRDKWKNMFSSVLWSSQKYCIYPKKEKKSLLGGIGT